MAKGSVRRIDTRYFDTAIKESAKIINSFRLYRSAHTPAKGDKKKVGRKPQIIDMVIITPD